MPPNLRERGLRGTSAQGKAEPCRRVSLGTDREEAAGRPALEAERLGARIVEERRDGCVLAGQIEPVLGAVQTEARGHLRSPAADPDRLPLESPVSTQGKYVAYRAVNIADAVERAAVDGERLLWSVLDAYWRPAHDGSGGTLLLQVEEPV